MVYGRAARENLVYCGRKLEVCFAFSHQSTNAHGAHLGPNRPEPELQLQARPQIQLYKLCIYNVHVDATKVSTVMPENALFSAVYPHFPSDIWICNLKSIVIHHSKLEMSIKRGTVGQDKKNGLKQTVKNTFERRKKHSFLTNCQLYSLMLREMLRILRSWCSNGF